MGGLDPGGPFRAALEAALGALRRRREALGGLVEAVLWDPGVDWAVEREDAAARQDMELAVALNLFASRCVAGCKEGRCKREQVCCVVVQSWEGRTGSW